MSAYESLRQSEQARQLDNDDHTPISSQPPQLQLQFDRLSLGDRPQSSASIGVSSVLSFVKSTIPSPEPSYDMVDSSDDDSNLKDGTNGNYVQHQRSANGSSPTSSGVLVDRPSPGTADRSKLGQRNLPLGDSSVDEDSYPPGIPDRRQKQTKAPHLLTHLPYDGSPKYANPIASPDTPLEQYHQQQQPRPLTVTNGDSDVLQPAQPSYRAYSPGAYDHKVQDDHRLHAPGNAPSVRPVTSESRLFDDFDGIHFNPELRTLPQSNPLPMEPQPTAPVAPPPPPPPPHRPSHQGRMSHYGLPGSDGSSSNNLVYYPAPVPALLNLPPSLTKSRNRDTGAANRKSMLPPGLLGPGTADDSKNRRDQQRSVPNLPPSLRASAFFDHTAGSIEFPVKEESAVATLDSMLDAAAKAPPVAFTEHPMTSGPSFQAPHHTRNRSTGNVLKNRQSVATMGGFMPEQRQRSSQDMADRDDDTRRETIMIIDQDGNERGVDMDLESQDPGQNYAFHQSQMFQTGSDSSPIPSPEPDALPTTLMAELEARQVHQRSRNRTAASAFPSGIRSTLLELDAVAQVQKDTRRVRRTHLAWEKPEDKTQEEEDEDTPLGLLYNGNAQHRKDEDVPLGLLVKKEIEDNEPLSKRRERLKGTPGDNPRNSAKEAAGSRSTVYLSVPGLDSPPDEAEAEGETLAARMKKLKEKKNESEQFGSGSLGLLDAEDKGGKPPEEKEETLGQRRRRLQMEKDPQKKTVELKRESLLLQAEVRKRRSLMDIMQAQQNNPIPLAMRSQTQLGMYPQFQQQTLLGGHMQGGNVGPGVNQFGGGARGMGMGMGGGAYIQPNMNMSGGLLAPIAQSTVQDAKQREMVERWRSSIM